METKLIEDHLCNSSLMIIQEYLNATSSFFTTNKRICETTLEQYDMITRSMFEYWAMAIHSWNVKT